MPSDLELKKALQVKDQYVKCCSCNTTMLGILKISAPPRRVVCVSCDTVIPFDGSKKSAA